MADLSGYTPIYVRSNGNDSTGDGSSGSPYLTAQKAFEIAYNGTGNKVLDFGSGNFGGVNLNTTNASNWPSRISVRGAGATESFLGGINANGVDEVYDYDIDDVISPATSGKNISIVSDKSINLGNISSNGGNGDLSGFGVGGAITLTDSISSNINSNGGNNPGNDYGGGGGPVTLTNSTSSNINSNGGGGYGGGAGGAITLTDSTSGNISSNGGNGYIDGYTGSSGAVTLSGSTIIPNLIIASSVNSTNLRRGRGVNGSSILGLV